MSAAPGRAPRHFAEDRASRLFLVLADLIEEYFGRKGVRRHLGHAPVEQLRPEAEQ